MGWEVDGGGDGDGGGSKIKPGKRDLWWQSSVAAPQNTGIALHA
jgi:hypothetical protein